MTKLKTSSVRVYFFECRAGGSKSKDFWPTIKPFLSKKGSGGNSEILLSENDKIISDQKEVYEIFNNFIVNVAKDIGSDTGISDDFKTDPSIAEISENLSTDIPEFSFKVVSEKDVEKIVTNNLFTLELVYIFKLFYLLL